MLCQLVCTDRRYARMNCFNIRELQGILKRRFFTDMVNSHDHRDILNSSMIVAKFKLNSEANVSLDNTLFYNWGIFKGNHLKLTNFGSNKVSGGRSFLSYSDTYLTSFFRPVSGLFFLPDYLNYMFGFLTFHVFTMCNVFFNIHLLFFSMFSSFLSFFNGSLVVSLFNAFAFNLATFRTPTLGFYQASGLTAPSNQKAKFRNFSSKDAEAPNYYSQFLFTENSSSQRATRFSNALVNYDYKTGHYLGE